MSKIRFGKKFRLVGLHVGIASRLSIKQERSATMEMDIVMVRTDPLSYLSEQLEAWRKAGTYQHLRELQSACEPIARFDGREVINLASNNYLGLADHPKLVEAEIEAAKRYGAGSGAVRTISGTMSLHLELERRIAAFKNVEACVVFQSGFAANAGT